MHRRSTLPLLAAGFIALSGLASAETPTANNIVDRAIIAAELESSMAEHDMIQLAIHQEETTSDGTAHASDVTALIHGANLENSRLELGQGTSLVLNNSDAWAILGGQLDTRVQTPRMAAGAIRQTLFPLLLPFSLRMEGVRLGAVTEGSFDGTPVWEIDIDFTPEFFSAPSMVTTWKVFVSRKDNLVLGAEFLPNVEYIAGIDEGIRYRYLKRQDTGGISLAAQVLLDGIDFNGMENGHVRVTKMTAKTAGPLDLSLFIHPEEQERLDSGDVF